MKKLKLVLMIIGVLAPFIVAIFFQPKKAVKKYFEGDTYSGDNYTAEKYQGGVVIKEMHQYYNAEKECTTYDVTGEHTVSGIMINFTVPENEIDNLPAYLKYPVKNYLSLE